MATIQTINAGDLISASRADINTNFTNLNTGKIETSVIDTDTSLSANSDAKIPSQKAVKAYVDAGGQANASTTVKGIVELATSAEIDAGTAIGATGAALVVTADALKGSLAPVVRTYLNAVSPATWTKPTGLKYIVVEVQAAGGDGSTATSTDLKGGGGGGGGYSKKLISTGSLGATETVTIGAVGANSSFGAHATANAGTTAGPNSNNGGAGGTAASGDINIPGQAGGTGDSNSGFLSGPGGGSMFSNGAPGVPGSSGGLAATGYGGGGSGGNASGTTDQLGGTGAPAIVIVTEYYV